MTLRPPPKVSACHAVFSDPSLFATVLRQVPLADRGSLAATSKQFNIMCAAGNPKMWAQQFAPAFINDDTCMIEAQRFVRHDHVAHLTQTFRPQALSVLRPLGTFQGKTWRLKAPVFDVYKRDQPAAIHSIQTRLDIVAIRCMNADLPRDRQAPILIYDSHRSAKRLRALLIDADASIDAANRVFTGALLRTAAPLIVVIACFVSRYIGLSASTFWRQYSVRKLVENAFFIACVFSTVESGIKHVKLLRLRHDTLKELQLLRAHLPDAIAYHSGGALLE